MRQTTAYTHTHIVFIHQQVVYRRNYLSLLMTGFSHRQESSRRPWRGREPTSYLPVPKIRFCYQAGLAGSAHRTSCLFNNTVVLCRCAHTAQLSILGSCWTVLNQLSNRLLKKKSVLIPCWSSPLGRPLKRLSMSLAGLSCILFLQSCWYIPGGLSHIYLLCFFLAAMFLVHAQCI